MLNIPGLRVISTNEEEDRVEIVVQSTITREECPFCLGSLYKHGPTKQYTYNDTPIYGKPCSLLVTLNRYRCRQCKKTCQDEIEELNSSRFMTKRLLSIIEKESLRHTFIEVSRKCGVNEKTVRNAFKDQADRMNAAYKIETPEFLGIDEVQTAKKTLRCMITNVTECRLIDMLPTRKMEDIEPYFMNLPDKHIVKAVAMDMWRAYRDVVTKYLPQAKIVIDKFHVVRLACFGIDKVRISMKASLPRNVKNRLKDERWLLLTRKENLDIDRNMNLQMWFLKFPDLAVAYKIKEAFFEFYQCKTRSDADAYLNNWLTNFPAYMKQHFSELLSAIQNWRPFILNYFDIPITNAFTESKNRLVKDLNREGRGYSFDVIRVKLLFDEDVMKRDQTSVRKKIKKARDAGIKPSGKRISGFDEGKMMVGYAAPSSSSGFSKMAGLSPVSTPKTEEEEYEIVTIYKGPRFSTLIELLEAGHFD